jgi:lipopolysaccharide export system permease protein
LCVHAGHLGNKAERFRLQVLGIVAEQHMRPALALGCLCFTLIGCPVAIWLSRSDYLSAFLVCFLPIVLLYYPLMLCGTDLAKSGHVPPVLSVWAADFLLGGAGLWLLRRLHRR